MTSTIRTYVTPAVAGSVAVLLTLFVAPLAAQQPDTALLSSLPITDQLPAPRVTALPPAALTPDPAFWELISGYEADTAGSSYGFFGPSYLRPMRPGLAWTARVTGSFLSYEFGGLDEATRVRSPGLGAAIGLKFGNKNTVTVVAGPEVKWGRREVTDATGVATTHGDTRLGMNFGGELYANPTSHNNIQGIVNYNTSDRYTWSRLGFKEQITNLAFEGPTALFVGVEGIAQGNFDIRSKQLGGFVEIALVPARTSIMFKGGYKRSTFNAGPDLTGPYFSVGFYKRLN